MSYTYTVEVEFENLNFQEDFQGKILYHKKGEQFYYDKLFISSNIANIECKRSSKRVLSEILQKPKDEIYKSFYKTIVYLALIGKDVSLRTIKLYDKNNTYIINKNNIYGTIKITKQQSFFSAEEASVVFEHRSDDVFTAATYNIKGIENIEKIEGFVKLWQSFNCLYKYLYKKEKDADNLKSAREDIEIKEQYFPETLSLFEKYKDESLRWQEFIENTFIKSDKKIKMGRLEKFITNNKSKKIIEIMNGVIQENMYLEQSGESGEQTNRLENLILSSIENNNDSDWDELITVILDYCYFVRNNHIHASSPDYLLYIEENNVTKEIQKLNQLLSVFVFELIVGIKKVYSNRSR